MTFLVYAGSSQLAAIPLIVAGAPAWVILATGFCVNLRFVVFSLHLRPYLMHMPRWRRHGQRLPHRRHELCDVHAPLSRSRRTTDGRAARAGGLPLRQLLRDLDAPGWASSLLGIALANLIPQQLGPGFRRRAVPGRHPVLAGEHAACACWPALIAGARGGGGLRAAAQAQYRGGHRRRGAGCASGSRSSRRPPARRTPHERGGHRPVDAGGHLRPGRRHRAHALLLLHPRPALGACPTGRIARCTTRRWRRWRAWSRPRS